MPIVVGFFSWLASLGSTRVKAETVVESKPVRCTPSWPLHYPLPPGSIPAWITVLTFFDDGLWSESIGQINFSLLTFFWPWCFIASVETLTMTLMNTNTCDTSQLFSLPPWHPHKLIQVIIFSPLASHSIKTQLFGYELFQLSLF